MIQGQSGGRAPTRRAWWTRSCGAVLAAAWLGPWGLLAAQSERDPGLVVEYQTKGLLPGAGPDEKPGTVYQKIQLDGTGARLIYEERREGAAEGRKVLLRADGPAPVIQELLPGNRYRQHSGDLNQIQKDRNITEQNEILAAKQLPAKDREAFFRENPWLRPDGKREVKVERTAGEKVLGEACDHLKVTENGRVIIEGEVARLAAASASGPFQLYRRLGAFSDEVLAQLEQVEGVLLRGKILVVTALRAHEFSVEATKVTRAVVDAGQFSLAGWTLLEEPTEVACPVCGKAVDPRQPGGKLVLQGRVVLFSSEECLDAFQRELLKTQGAATPPGAQQKPPRAGAGGLGGPPTPAPPQRPAPGGK